MPQALVDLEISHPGLTTLEVVGSMAERKTRMEQLADAFICLPGGVGTLEELTEVLTLQQLGTIRGPVGLVNTEDFGVRSTPCTPPWPSPALSCRALWTHW